MGRSITLRRRISSFSRLCFCGYSMPGRTEAKVAWVPAEFLKVALARCIEMRVQFLFGSLLVAATTVAQIQKASDVADFVSVDTPVFVLEHVRVIDGTGTPAEEDQAVVIANGKIQFIGP